ncbi:hypothetical protein A6U91_07475 [Agrobacterium tumefaciens]|uniref:Uncharacterized protein n=2 Tax=Agrobacterium tumefaciens TaxID=358 RepID=A0AB36EJK6_AGRTU|nr:hypothetical protein A6U91_07475 [Agrobacterium tumefaciens]
MKQRKLDMALETVRRWYRGAYVPPDEHPGIFMLGYHKRHWTAELLHTIVEFYLKHWQWVIATVIAIVGLLLM